MAGHTYTCDHCGGIFESSWSESDALMEYQEKFTEQSRSADPELPVRVCDVCYQLLMDRLARDPDFNRRHLRPVRSVPSAKSRPH